MNFEQVIEELEETLECMKDSKNTIVLTCVACKSVLKKVYEWSISEENK